MKEPDFSKTFPKRFITMSMADKYMAVCFIYDGVQYQNLCREEGPDGTFNYSEKCLSKLPYQLPFIGYDLNTSLTTENGLVKYDRQDQAEFPDILSAISYYWLEVLILCLLSALTFNLAFVTFRRRSSRIGELLNYYLGTRYFNTSRNTRFSAMPTVDEQGTISVGKISFNPKQVLGYGSKGTCVFKGSFESSINCAVKRVVSQYLTLADREVDFLRSLQNPNLVRYLATEEDAQFIYISLELAEYTLGDLIESKRVDQIGLTKEQLCQQAALGLQHLHKMNIVHRDIKPQNILISFPLKPNNERKVMISDFGLSKQLSNLDTGHTSSAMRYFDGTQGWMAPEIIHAKLSEVKTLLPTKSADIFSLGCVFYYIMSEGQHAFGPPDQRQSNILKDICMMDSFNVKNENNLSVREDVAIMSSKLIRAMIQNNADQRPPIGTVLKYPIFWSRCDQLQFLQDASDRVDKEEGRSDIIYNMERGRQKIFAYSWRECLSKELQEDLKSFRSYNERSVRHLIRAIRNKKHHYRELSSDLKNHLGDLPDGFMDYFSSRFPELLPHIYQAMQPCKGETIFRTYYEQVENFLFT